jgi:hypothetical protein
VRENEELKQMWNHEAHKYHLDNVGLQSRIDQLKTNLADLNVSKQEVEALNRQLSQEL